jgi:hypothetical protein
MLGHNHDGLTFNRQNPYVCHSRSSAIPSAPQGGMRDKDVVETKGVGVNVVSQPVCFLVGRLDRMSAFQIAPRAVSAMNRLLRRVEGDAVGHQAREPSVLAALRDVGVTAIVAWRQHQRMSRPYTTNADGVEIDSFAIGWMRNTSSQLIAGVEVHWLAVQ